MAAPVRLVCPECGSEDVRQIGWIGAMWCGEATLCPITGTRSWEDDGNGADVFWDAMKIEGLDCLCGWGCDGEAYELLVEQKQDDEED